MEVKIYDTNLVNKQNPQKSNEWDSNENNLVSNANVICGVKPPTFKTKAYRNLCRICHVLLISEYITSLLMGGGDLDGGKIETGLADRGPILCISYTCCYISSGVTV
jgi:hypothetical protein